MHALPGSHTGQYLADHIRSILSKFFPDLKKMLIGVNFYKAARLEPPPPFFKLLGFRASEPPNFLSHATPIAVFCGLPNNKMTPNDIHANQTNTFIV